MKKENSNKFMILKWQYIVCIKGKILYKLKETFFDNSFFNFDRK